MSVGVPVLIALATLVFGAGGIASILISGFMNRGGRRADVADKLSETAGKWLERADEKIEAQAGQISELRTICYDLMLIVEDAAETLMVIAQTHGVDAGRAKEWRTRALKARIKMQD